MKTKPQSYHILFILTLGLCSLSSCFNSSSKSVSDKNDSTLNKEDGSDLPISDTGNELKEDDTFAQKKVFKNPEVQEAHKEIVKKYGEQWDLCRCIEKSDSVNKVLMHASDENFDMVMERSNFIDQKCKDMLIHPNETPEERYEYQKKVDNCLKATKK